MTKAKEYIPGEWVSTPALILNLCVVLGKSVKLFLLVKIWNARFWWAEELSIQLQFKGRKHVKKDLRGPFFTLFSLKIDSSMPKLFLTILISPILKISIEVSSNYLGCCTACKYALRDSSCACGKNLTFLTLNFHLESLLEYESRIPSWPRDGRMNVLVLNKLLNIDKYWGKNVGGNLCSEQSFCGVWGLVCT